MHDASDDDADAHADAALCVCVALQAQEGRNVQLSDDNRRSSPRLAQQRFGLDAKIYEAQIIFAANSRSRDSRGERGEINLDSGVRCYWPQQPFGGSRVE